MKSEAQRQLLWAQAVESSCRPDSCLRSSLRFHAITDPGCTALVALLEVRDVQDQRSGDGKQGVGPSPLGSLLLGAAIGIGHQQ